MKWLIAIILVPVVLSVMLTQWGVRQAEIRHPPIGRFAEIDGVRLHYSDRGPSAPSGDTQPIPLILIHGASTSLLDLDASIAPRLARNFRVVCVDRPGHGYSQRTAGPWPDPRAQARLVHGLALHLGLERPLLVGHSWGGSLVLAYLLDYPQEASAGVLLTATSHPWTGGVAWYNDLTGVPLLGRLFAHTMAGPLGRLGLDAGIAAVMAPEPVPAQYRERTGVDLSLRPGAFLANGEDIRRLSPFLEVQSRRYPQLTRPLLLITGDQDTIVPPRNHRDRLLRDSPQARSVVFAGAGHGLHHSHTPEIAALIEDFAALAKEAVP